jgi:hypothetical protein
MKTMTMRRGMPQQPRNLGATLSWMKQVRTNWDNTSSQRLCADDTW